MGAGASWDRETIFKILPVSVAWILSGGACWRHQVIPCQWKPAESTGCQGLEGFVRGPNLTYRGIALPPHEKRVGKAWEFMSSIHWSTAWVMSMKPLPWCFRGPSLDPWHRFQAPMPLLLWLQGTGNIGWGMRSLIWLRVLFFILSVPTYDNMRTSAARTSFPLTCTSLFSDLFFSFFKELLVPSASFFKEVLAACPFSTQLQLSFFKELVASPPPRFRLSAPFSRSPACLSILPSWLPAQLAEDRLWRPGSSFALFLGPFCLCSLFFSLFQGKLLLGRWNCRHALAFPPSWASWLGKCPQSQTPFACCSWLFLAREPLDAVFSKKMVLFFQTRWCFFQTKGAKLAKYVFYHQYTSSVPQSGNFLGSGLLSLLLDLILLDENMIR